MELINRQKIEQGIHKTLKLYRNSGPQAEHVGFIIDRFFHYMIIALMHGFKCSIKKQFKFSMVYIFIKDVPKTMRKSVFFSSRAFGYSFYLIAESKKMDYFGYTFRTDKALMKQIAEHNESDIIYKLIKK